MATPIEFPEQTMTLRRPDSMTEEQCVDLPVCKITDGRLISCWKLTGEEMMEVLQTGEIWISVWGGNTHPPISVLGERPFVDTEGDADGA